MKIALRNFHVNITNKFNGLQINLPSRVFDPVFNLSGTYSRRRTYERSEFISRERENFSGTLIQDIVPGDALSSDLSNDLVCITVDGLIVSAEQCGSLRTEVRGATERASFDSGAAETWQIDFGASKRFPWGSLLEIQFQSIKIPRNAFGTPVDPFDLDRLLAPTDRPWTSSFFAALTSPLPFSKNFGP